MSALVRGVYAAIFSPRDEDGQIDYDVLKTHVEWVLDAGVEGAVVGGATAEYPYTSEAESRRLIETVASVAGPNRFIAGIGGGTVQQCIRQGKHAMEAGARALLLPAPHFFQYSQEDVAAFARSVAEAVPGPVLLYQLPQFSNGFSLESALTLIESGSTIVGIKDSSGSLDILRALTGRGADGISRIVGNDSALVAAQREGVCDAVISGVAAALPDLMVELFRATSQEDAEGGLPLAELLEEVIGQLNRFPVPWGLKWIAEARGLGPFGSPLPVSGKRQGEAGELTAWLEAFLPRLTDALASGNLASA